ncbi:hypothetical protein [Flavobacterium foetidum]|uniref:hypothetical protein n=1 Tax=Flavobacterium foetidum TaxID=2026681 RepID=UPI001FC9B769|nr:hypothetical protein [Flavobacterium foetidum]
MVEVFKTNVQQETETNYIIAVIKRQFPTYKINFDLEDCDKILRVEALEPQWNTIVDYLNNLGFSCVRLE